MPQSIVRGFTVHHHHLVRQLQVPGIIIGKLSRDLVYKVQNFELALMGHGGRALDNLGGLRSGVTTFITDI